jgi:hypothetical protein
VKMWNPAKVLGTTTPTQTTGKENLVAKCA